MNESILKTIRKLTDNGILVFMEGGNLRSKSLAASLTPELTKLIKDNKDKLIDYLNSHAALPEQNYIKTQKIISLPTRHLLFKSTFRHHWNMCGFINITDADPQLLKKSLEDILTRHEGLRHRFYIEDDMVCEDIIPLPLRDLLEVVVFKSHENKAEVIKSIENHASELQKIINLENNLFKFVLFKCPNGMQDRFLWILRHALIDGYSISIFFEELVASYRSNVANVKYEPLPDTTSIAEWGGGS